MEDLAGIEDREPNGDFTEERSARKIHSKVQEILRRMQIEHRSFAEADINWFRGFRGGENGGARFEIISRDDDGYIVDGPQHREVVQ